MIKGGFILASIVIFGICVPTQKHFSDDHKVLLKRYAFCRCFDYANADTNYFVNKDISQAVYRDFASGPPDALFTAMDSLAKIAASNIKPSVMPDAEGKKAVIFGCFRFYDSKELDSLIESYQVK